MNEELLAETIGEDTTTQLYRDGEGEFRVRVMALPEGGGEKTLPSQSPLIFHDRPVSEEDARHLFGAASARCYVESFPGAS